MILLTGFEAFGGDQHNPSASLASVLAAEDVAVRILPVDGSKIQDALKQAVQETQPTALLMLGLARGYAQITLEQVALNWLEYRIPDNAGQTQSGSRILPDHPDAYFSSLPLGAIRQCLTANCIPHRLSLSAGAFLCNQVFFLARALYPNLMAGFIHLPSDERLASGRAEAFLPLEYQKSVISAILKVVGGSITAPKS